MAHCIWRMQSKIKFYVGYVSPLIKLHPSKNFDRNRPRDVKVDFLEWWIEDYWRSKIKFYVAYITPLRVLLSLSVKRCKSWVLRWWRGFALWWKEVQNKIQSSVCYPFYKTLSLYKIWRKSVKRCKNWIWVVLEKAHFMVDVGPKYNSM